MQFNQLVSDLAFRLAGQTGDGNILGAEPVFIAIARNQISAVSFQRFYLIDNLLLAGHAGFKVIDIIFNQILLLVDQKVEELRKTSRLGFHDV